MDDSLPPTPRWTAPATVTELVRRPNGGANAAVEQESTLKSLLEFSGLVRRHWFLVGVITAFSVGLVLNQIRHELRLYAATAVVRLVDKARELSSGIARTSPSQPFRPFTDPVLSQIQVLKSRGVAEAVVEKEGLRLRALPQGLPPMWTSDVHVPSSAATSDTLFVSFSDSTVSVHGRTVVVARYGSPVSVDGIEFTVATRPAIGNARLIVIPEEWATGEVVANLSARSRDRTDVIDVSYTAPEPALAQRVVNAAVEVFQSMNASAAKQESVRRRQFIAQQLDKVELLLADARQAHNAFRERERVYSSEDKFKAQQVDLGNIDLHRQELLADRGTYARLLDELQHRDSTQRTTERLSALAASPGIADNPVVSQLFTQLVQYQGARDSLTTGTWGRAQDNPDIQRLNALIASTESRTINAVRANLSVIDARVAALDQEKSQVSAQMARLPAAEAEEATLLAQVETYSKESDRLRDELQSAEIAEAAEAGQIEIVDLATLPNVPLGSGRKPKVVLALLIGLALGVGAAYVRENYRPVIRRRDELQDAIALPNLALVPQIRTGNGNGLLYGPTRFLPRFARPHNGNGHALIDSSPAELVTLNAASSSGAEAYRTLRTNLLFSAAVQSLRCVTVTSPGPAEGKSTTAANVAIAFAQQGHRVLLIDCDLRRSRIHRMFNDSQTPGLTNVLAAGTQPSDAIRPTKVDGLMIMPSGATPPNPAELLGSVQMGALLEKLSSSYDMLILDTPPLLAASDAAILSRMSDGALVVVRAGRTERSALQTAIQQLGTVGARVLGTVLNDPDAEVPKYARYYGYYYNNYYEYQNGQG